MGLVATTFAHIDQEMTTVGPSVYAKIKFTTITTFVATLAATLALSTGRPPKATIEVLEGLTVEQHVSWKKAVKKIEDLLKE